jgi:hypothetical protein
MSPYDGAGGMAMLLAAVCAKGTSTINNARRPGLVPGPPCEREALIAAPRRVL